MRKPSLFAWLWIFAILGISLIPITACTGSATAGMGLTLVVLFAFVASL